MDKSESSTGWTMGHRPHANGGGTLLQQSTTFHRKLKTHLFRQSYPDIVL